MHGTRGSIGDTRVRGEFLAERGQMAEDNLTVAEGSASWNLQGRMGLHLCSSRLSPSPYAESGDSRDVSQGRSVFADPKIHPRPSADAAKSLISVTESWSSAEFK